MGYHPDSSARQRPTPTPARAFATVFLAVFLVVFVGSGIITFLLPERYAAVARVRAITDEQLQVFQSGPTLARVADQLNLGHTFAQRYGDTEPFGADRTTDMLRRGLQVRRVRGTSVAEIRVYSYDPREAAQLANAIAQFGASNSAKPFVAGTGRAEIIDLALPQSKPARPNKALNLCLGALVGAFLGIMAGGVGARLAVAPRGRP